MHAQLDLDDDLARYLSEQARQERTTLDDVLNRLLRRVVPGITAAGAANAQKAPIKPQVTLVRDPLTGRMVLTREAALPPITTDMVNDILNELP
jgi:negative regulator of replication initiation